MAGKTISFVLFAVVLHVVASHPAQIAKPCNKPQHFELDSWTNTGAEYDLSNAEVIHQNHGKPVIEYFTTADDKHDVKEKPIEVTHWENEKGQWEGGWEDDKHYAPENVHPINLEKGHTVTVDEEQQWESADGKWAKGDKHWVEGDKHWVEGDKHWVEGDKHWAEGDKHWAEGDKHWAEGDKHWAEGDQQWVAPEHGWVDEKQWPEEAAKPEYNPEIDTENENNAVIKEKVKTTTTKLRAETVVHKPSHIIVNQPPTKVLIHHPPLIVKPSAVVFHRDGKTIHRPVKHQYLPRKVEVRPVYHTVVKPIEKRVLIDNKQIEQPGCQKNVLVNRQLVPGGDQTWVENGDAYEVGKGPGAVHGCGCPGTYHTADWEKVAEPAD